MIGGVLIAAFLLVGNFYVSDRISTRFALLEAQAAWREADIVQSELRHELSRFIYQTQFATFEDVPQLLATDADPDSVRQLFGALRASSLGADLAFLFDSTGELIAGREATDGAAREIAPDSQLVNDIRHQYKKLRSRPEHLFQPQAFFWSHRGSMYFIAANPIIPWTPKENAKPVGLLAFGRKIDHLDLPLAEDHKVPVRIRPADSTPPEGLRGLPPPTPTNASWDTDDPIIIAFPSTAAGVSRISPGDRLMQIRKARKAGWLINLVLANKSAVKLHHTLSGAKLWLTPSGDSGSNAPTSNPDSPSTVTATFAQAGAGLPAIAVDFPISTELPVAVARSKHLVQATFLIAAVLICLFTAFVLREIRRRLHTEQSLENTNHQKDRLLSVIAHDLRAPLSGVGNLAQLMADTRASFTREETEGYAQEIHLTSKRLNELLENLLNWARLQSGELPISPATIDFPRLTDQIARLFHPAASAKAIDIVVDNHDVHTLRTDPEMLRTILRNLLSNAIRHSHEGARVHLESTLEKTDLVLQVRDSGDGIREDKIDTLFADPSGDRAGRRGFGLALCREFTELLGGSIDVQSASGKGSTFTVRLPGIATREISPRDFNPDHPARDNNLRPERQPRPKSHPSSPTPKPPE